MSLEHHVHQPTHEKGHTLDLIITRSPDTLISSIPAADELFSDHFSVSCSLSFPKPHLSSKIVTLRSKDLDLSLFLEDLSSSNLFTNPPEHPDDLLQLYNTTLRAVRAATRNSYWGGGGVDLILPTADYLGNNRLH